MARNKSSESYGTDRNDSNTIIKPDNKGKYTPGVSLTFKQNRSFPLHYGRKVIFFGPNETKKVSKEVVEHKDFENIANYFVIKEVK